MAFPYCRIMEQSKFLSRAFKDQLQTPVERAVFWVEYVIRHRGAHQLRSAARDLNIFQYYCLDVISLIIVMLVTILYILFAILRKISAPVKNCCSKDFDNIPTGKKFN